MGSMSEDFSVHKERRVLFGTDAAGYASGRPGYPAEVYTVLEEVTGLGPGTRVLEVGPGGGQATAELLARGADVTAVEISEPLAASVRERFANESFRVIVSAFEDAEVEGPFDLVASATAFHWVPPETGHAKAGSLLRAGGWLALWWNIWGDPEGNDPFHLAIQPLLQAKAPQLLVTETSGWAPKDSRPYAIRTEERVAEFHAAGCFGPVRIETLAWTGRHTAEQIRALFASFSPWLALDEPLRTEILDDLQQIAEDQFGGVVERPYLTAIYLAERR
jgi:SAM-dependent methyltransferase